MQRDSSSEQANRMKVNELNLEICGSGRPTSDRWKVLIVRFAFERALRALCEYWLIVTHNHSNG